jgi:hypothetical protein
MLLKAFLPPYLSVNASVPLFLHSRLFFPLSSKGFASSFFSVTFFRAGDLEQSMGAGNRVVAHARQPVLLLYVEYHREV